MLITVSFILNCYKAWLKMLLLNKKNGYNNAGNRKKCRHCLIFRFH
jgi:hypothetical protein